MMVNEAWFLSWRTYQSSDEIEATSGHAAAKGAEPEAQERDLAWAIGLGGVSKEVGAVGQHVGWEEDWVKDGIPGTKHMKAWTKGEESMREKGNRRSQKAEGSVLTIGGSLGSEQPGEALNYLAGQGERGGLVVYLCVCVWWWGD